MKKFYVVFSLIIYLNSFSQNELRGEWFLHYINIEGTQQYSTIPNSINTFVLDSETTFNGEICSNSYTGNYIFNNDNTLSITNFSTLGGFCSYEDEEDLFLNPYMWNILGLYTENPIYTYELNGSGVSETLKLIHGNGNFAFYGRQTLSNPKFTKEITIQITQNPVHEELKISTENDDFKDLSYSIHSIEGKIVIKKELLNQNIINVSYLETGIYFLSISTKNGQKHVLKFIKE
jgi:hypothetical protein